MESTAHSPSTLLAMRGINKSFFGVRVLKDVDFDLSYGEVHALLGENGAGKSTLMKILSGAYSLDSGSIELSGKTIDLSAHTPRSAEDAGIISIYQNFHLVPHLSVAENLSLSGFTRRRSFINWKRVYEHAREALGRIDFAMDPRERVRDLPVSRKQMLEIAIALSKHAKVLIMDEPTAALNGREVDTLFRTIREVRQAGIGIVYISHKLEEIREIADRVTVLRDGAREGTLPVKDLQMATVVRLMTGAELGASRRARTEEDGRKALIELQGLSIPGCFRDVSFRLREREVLGLTGLVGAGKTELARAIFGVDRLHGGRILLEGRPVAIDSPRKAARLGLGFLPEDRDVQGLCLNMGVKENISLSYLAMRTGVMINPGRERDMVRRMVAELRIRASDLSQHVKYLSGGNKQKVVLGKLLSARCRVLIMDEPTFGIDVGAREEIYRLIDDYAHGQGNAVLFVSSDIEEILTVTDRILVMAGGRIVSEAKPGETTKQKIIEICLRQSSQANEG
ncbi:MAG: sugar ABC transporter ATP-binding protein [Spirochaetia bacterium]|jgi:ribose transport system ATP-binding protein